MAENKNINNELEYTEEESLFITLTDEDGKEIEFEVIGEAVLDGVTYYAMMPAENANAEEGLIEYVLLKKEKDEDGEDLFITLDDEDEFDDDEDWLDDEDDVDGDFYEVTCPSCGEAICFDESVEPENLTCPACGEKFACEFDEDDLTALDGEDEE